MSDRSRKRRSTRVAETRKRSIYAEPDTEDDFSLSDEEFSESDRPAKRTRNQTSTRTRHTADDIADDAAPDATPPSTGKSRRKKSVRMRRSKRTTTVGANVIKKVVSLVGRPRGRRNKTSKFVSKPVPVIVEIPSDGVQPSWHELPYEVLLQIFTYAYINDSHSWLLKTARTVCKAFAEPALTAFYQQPRLPTSAHLEHLHALAQYPDGHGWMKYRVKVRKLELDINAFVNRKDEDDTFELASLISKLPKLEEVLITSVQDKPPYRRHALPRWKYPASLFDALENTERQLRSWRWNWLFVRQTGQAPRLYDYMCKHHQSPAFQNVSHLEISDHPEFVTSAEDQAHQEDKIAEAIALLPSLKSLELETCDIVNARFLERLPKSLSRLRLANCEALTSEAIEVFLSQDGGCQLESLVLDHNVRLDLAFLPLLKSTCSKLKHLSMDLHYYSQHHTVNDAEARYKQLLTADEVPTWPSTLESIEMIHLQKWSADGGQSLFGSLIDSAKELPNLRKLVLHAHISISWRDRASFREQWIDKLTKVFLRKCKDPDPNLASLKAFRIAKDIEKPSSPDDLRPQLSGRTVSNVEIPRRSISEVDFSSHENTHDEGAASSTARRSRRIAEVETQRARRSDSRRASIESISSSDEAEGSDTEGTGKDGTSFKQGMCHIVDVKIDNQRPREEQFNESHFLDSEESGDGDWNEEGDELLDDGYAW
ncbi:hypothetical protein B9Z65_9065 [Elsinoe australis]|uniref:F-box domain-containing protein n=1 Tax=Elsinoe australis TaxID=40998 RepID=A0A2P8ABP8_9PEZI|nr:hypothetical protein B9Z65_9065 [Elsinoe australis]